MQKWQKQGLAALLLLIVLAGSLFASEPEKELRQVPAEVPEPKEERPVHQAVEGSERAASSKELTNPFTMLHETRAEREMRPGQLLQKKEQALRPYLLLLSNRLSKCQR